MSFISYAQNFEDVMLWRALSHVENGRYIDIGAQDPLIDSVSMGFYEKGWRGIHVEPTEQYAAKLRTARPDERVLQVAIGREQGLLTFYEFKDTGLSTADSAIAQQHLANGFTFIETHVPIISLDTLLDECESQPIHWLKIDVEGHEKNVLESWQLSPVRPWTLIIESTLPLTQEPSHDEWEHLVIAKGYEFVYFDGLNRFYISSEHSYLKDSFDRPPNIFDGFVLSGLASQPFYARAAECIKASELKSEQAEARAGLADMHARHALLIAEEMMAFVSQFKQKQQIQYEQVLGAVDQIQTRISLADENNNLRTQQALQLAAEARAHATELEIRNNDQSEKAVKIAEQVKFHAEGLDKLYQDQADQALGVAKEALTYARQAEAQSLEAKNLLTAMLHSRSWRMTAPYRWLGRQVHRLRNDGYQARYVALIKTAARPFLYSSIKFVDAHPDLRQRCVSVAKRLNIDHALRTAYLRLSQGTRAASAAAFNESTNNVHSEENGAAPEMSDQTCNIYTLLQVEIAAYGNKEAGNAHCH